MGKEPLVLLFYMTATRDDCRTQLGKLPSRIADLTREGAAVLAIGIDPPEKAARPVKNLVLPFAILSDPRMDVIRAYGMKGDGMDMAAMGYVVIDKQGRIRTRRIDRRFGENVGAIASPAGRSART